MEKTIRELERLTDEIDVAVARLERHHGDRLQCRRGCASCCVDGISVFEIEAARIRRHHRDLLSRGRPHPDGACAFLDDHGACRVYSDRPYVCRTQGLPLRWLDEEREAELRDICPLNELAEEPVEQLPESECWTLGPYESRLAVLQIEDGGAPPRRVSLRDLFARADG